MENNQHSESHKRNKRFLLVLPLIVIPFITVIFWLMGGGNETASVAKVKTGLNLQLPNVLSKNDSAKDKLAFYQMADADSIKRLEQLRMDPYFKDSVNIYSQKTASALSSHFGPTASYRNEPSEQKLNERIAALQRQLSAPQRYNVEKEQPPTGDYETAPLSSKQNLPRQTDPEIEALNNTLEKLLEVQQPERLKEKVAQKNRIVFEAGAEENEDKTYFGKQDTIKKQGTFYHELTEKSNRLNAITAVIPASQVLQRGSVVKLQLISAIAIKGVSIPAGSFVFGVAAIENERMYVKISFIRNDNNLIPVSMSVFDLDGLEGIYVPGSMIREVTKETTDQTLQSVQVLSLDNSLKSQVAAAGIGAAKSLFGKKVKQVRVTIKAGYKVLLRNDNQANN